MIFSIAIAHNASLGIVYSLDAPQISDWWEWDHVEREGIAEDEVGKFIRRDEPAMRGSTPVEVPPAPLEQINPVSLVGTEQVPELNSRACAPCIVLVMERWAVLNRFNASHIPGHEPRRTRTRNTGSRCG